MPRRAGAGACPPPPPSPAPPTAARRPPPVILSAAKDSSRRHLPTSRPSFARRIDRLLLAAAACALLSGCGWSRQVEPGPPLPPRNLQPGRFWSHGLAELKYGDEQAALAALEQAADLNAEKWPLPDRSLFMRDLAELRLALGQAEQVAAPVAIARAAYEEMDLTSTFTAAERDLQLRLVHALHLAAAGDAPALEALAAAPGSIPLADPWYLLGWTRQRAGDLAGARIAFRHYLDLAPQFGLLRRSPAMRAHAAEVIRA